MAKIPAKLRLEDKFEGDIDKVQNMIDDAYNDIAPNLNTKPDMVIRESGNPTPADIDHDMGTFLLNRSTPRLFILTDIDETTSPNTPTWMEINLVPFI